MARTVANVRPSTINNYRLTFRKLSQLTRTASICTLTPQVVREYLVRRKAEGLQASSLHQERSRLITFLRWCVREGYIEPLDWSERIERVKRDNREARVLTPEECRKFLFIARAMPHKTTLAAKRDVAMLYVFLDTALREGEVIAMRVNDLDLEARTIRVQSTCKSRRERLVYFSGETLRALRAYLKVREQSRGGRSSAVWITRDGRPPSKGLVLRMVQTIARRAGLDGVSVHTLRHTAGTMMLRNGMPVAHVQRILGHTRIETTMRYVHLLDKDVEEQYQEAAPMERLAG